MSPRRSAARPAARAPLRRPASPRGAAAGERALRAALVEVCRRLHSRDLIGAGEGNVSVRLGPDRFLVTPSGVNKGYLAPGDLVVVDARGAVVAGRGRASTELRMHLAGYAARSDVAAVVHAHPITAVALTVAGVPPPNDLVPEAAVTLGEIAVAPFATPGTDEVPASLAPLWARHDVVLLERHGALALGRTLDEAFDRMETLERVARVALVARLAGSCEPLPAAAIEKVLAAAGRPPRGR
ncbi:MAG TPA: class II aldolase/adducin family protein [Anaeromyxobacter sp.]|nr:class II aldolase/adducin family protein [Anaeromyxobacter sp.]